MPSGKGPSRDLLGAFFGRRPALPAAVCLILGILSHQEAAPLPAVWIALILLLVVAAFFLLSRPVLSTLCLIFALFLAGVTVAQLQAFYFSPRDIAAYTSDEARLARLELRIETAPRVHVSTDAPRPLPPKEAVAATVLRIKTKTAAGDVWTAATGQVLLQLDQPHPRLAAGQTVFAIGRLQRPSPPLNPGQWDWAAYYRERRILASLTVTHADGLELLAETSPSPLERLRESTRRLLARGFSAGDSHDHATLRALLLGDRDAEMRDVQDGFSKAGAAHLLAVSGLHVAIVAGFVYLLCRLLRAPPRFSAWAMMASVLVYGLIVLPATPALRAVGLCLVFGSGLLQRRVGDALQTLSLTCCALLLYRPLDLYSAGFQLSFGTVFGLIVYAGPLSRFIARFEDEDLKVARSFRPPTRSQAFRLYLKRRLIDYLAFGGIAWLISAPLVAAHFNQLNSYAVPSGLLLFPLVVLGVIGGVVKLVLSLLLPSLSATWAALSLLPIRGMEHLVAWLSHLPGADIPLAAPPLWGVLLYYGLLAVPLLPITLPPLKRFLRAAPVAATAMALGVPFLGAAPPSGRPLNENAAPAGDTRITLLAIGAGQIGVIELPSKQVILIDDGSSSLADPLRTCLAPYLRSRGIRTVKTIYLSHPDFDHISATADTAEEFDTSQVVTNPVFRDQSRGNLPAETMLERLDARHVPTLLLSRGGRAVVDESTTVDALWPPPDRAIKSTNNAGLVLKLTCHGRSILFPADIQADTERELMQHPDELKSDVLVAPHHGSSEVTTADFLRAVNPSVILSSNDRTLSHKQKEFDKLAGEIPLYRTNRCGAITVVISKTGEMRVETFLKVEPQKGGAVSTRH